MKKNILIVYSLLVLPLIISSSLLSMDLGPDQVQRPNSQDQFLKELVQQGIEKIEQRKLNPTPNTSNKKHETTSIFGAADLRPETIQNDVFCYAATEVIQESPVFQGCATNVNSSDANVHDSFSKENIQQPTTREENSLLASRISVEQLKTSPLFQHQQKLHTSQVQSNEHTEVTVAQNTNEADFTRLPIIEQLVQELTPSQPAIAEQPSTLGLESAMMPTKKKKLDGWKRLDAALANIDIFGIYSTINNVMSYLKNNTYDFNNVKCLNLLHKALTDAAEADDFDSLVKIAALCQSTEDYKKNIRINSEVATSAFEVLTTKYNQELDHSNNTINNMYHANALKVNEKTAAFVCAFTQLTNAYLKEIKDISEDTASKFTTLREQEESRIKPTQESITTFSNLNKSIRPKKDDLLKRTIQPKENKIAEQCAQSEEQLKSLLGIIDKMPKVENITVLQLTK